MILKRWWFWVIIVLLIGGYLWLDYVFRPPPELIWGGFSGECESDEDCFARADICECVTREFYEYVSESQCEDFGCECIDRRCEKVPATRK